MSMHALKTQAKNVAGLARAQEPGIDCKEGVRSSGPEMLEVGRPAAPMIKLRGQFDCLASESFE